MLWSTTDTGQVALEGYHVDRYDKFGALLFFMQSSVILLNPGRFERNQQLSGGARGISKVHPKLLWNHALPFAMKNCLI
jgi:hypothetical protein